MNIGEANDFNALVRGLDPSADEDTARAAVEAAERLGDRAYKALSAGPSGSVVRGYVDAVIAYLVWEGDDEPTLRRVETSEPVAGVL